MATKAYPKTRTMPMEVLVLGLCRTGTLSMKLALEDLGYKNIYHMSNCTDSPTHPDLWLQALNAKYGANPNPSLLTTSFFDQILGDYSAVTDIPCACFAPELISAYPSAKIILTTRSPGSWYASMLSTIHALQISRYNRFLLRFSDAHLRKLGHLMDVIVAHFFEGSIATYGERGFEAHNEMVLRICRREGREVLVFKVGGGWGRLCGFLGKDVPEREFPHVNERGSWRRSFGLEWSWMILLLFGVLGTLLAVVWIRLLGR